MKELIEQVEEFEEINDPADFRMPMELYGLLELQQLYYRYQQLEDVSWSNFVVPIEI